VLFLGSTDARRDALLASYADVLWPYRAKLLIPSTTTGSDRRADYLAGDEKHHLLAESKILVNLHRGASRSMEWVRVLEAISNGCVVISEHSSDHEPLVPGEHFVSAAPESVGLLAVQLLNDPVQLAALRCRAYDFVRNQLPLEASVRKLVAVADDLVARSAMPAAAASGDRPPTPSIPVQGSGPEPDRVTAELFSLRAEIFRLGIEVRRLRRQLPSLGGGILESPQTPDPRRWGVVVATPSFEVARPRVSVIMPLFNHEVEVLQAIASLIASTYEDWELSIQDDQSDDRSCAVVRDFLVARSWLPARLTRSKTSSGPGPARNDLIDQARGEFVFMFDSDNKIYPPTIARLVSALDATPQAAFAYPMIAAFEAGVAQRLISRQPWDPELLRPGNYIDTMALLRRSIVVGIGGYGEDPRLLGMEDYDLWCRLADAGHCGIHVPEILGWYRSTKHSLIATQAYHWHITQSLVRERAPSVFAP
jgi:GT2 family glycosyltransferase